MITELTPEQQAQLEVYASKWRDIGLSTEPANRPEAEKGVKLAYELAGLDPPKECVWFESPQQLYLSPQIIRGSDSIVESKIQNIVETLIDECVQDYIVGPDWDDGYGEFSTFENDWSREFTFLRNIVPMLKEKLLVYIRWNEHKYTSARMQAVSWHTIHSHTNVNWLGFNAFCIEVLKPPLLQTKFSDLNIERFTALCHLAQHSGWLIPYDDVCLFSEKYSALNLDSEDRLHCENGLAIGYPDGWGIYAWHGVIVPEYVIMRPHEITPEKILKEENTEIARIMLERYGQDNFIRDGGFSKVQSDDYGELYRIDFPHDEPIVAVKVKDASTDREYFLYVPPHIQSAHEGVAWTFGYDNVSDYNPDKET